MKKLFCMLLFVASYNLVHTQTPSDYEFWTGASVKLKLNKKFKANLQQQVRFNDTISSLKKTFTEIGLKYNLNKSIAFKVSYRYIIRPNKKNQNRFSADTYYNWSKKKFPLSLSYRLRFQNTKNAVSGKNFTYLRNKITFNYNLSKLVDPYLAYEIFFRFNTKNEFRVSRLTAGLDWRLSKKMTLTTFYRWQRDIYVKSPQQQHIAGLLFNYDLSLKKIKKNRLKKKNTTSKTK